MPESRLPTALAQARRVRKGHQYQEQTIGRVYEHHWGRTLMEGDNSLFTMLTMNTNPLYFNAEYGRALGHPGVMMNPFYVFLLTVSLGVEDQTEGLQGGGFLGVDNLAFHQPMYAGDTLTARSTVTDERKSKSRPEQGIITWHVEGFNQKGELIIEFDRSVLALHGQAAP